MSFLFTECSGNAFFVSSLVLLLCLKGNLFIQSKAKWTTVLKYLRPIDCEYLYSLVTSIIAELNVLLVDRKTNNMNHALQVDKFLDMTEKTWRKLLG